MQLTLLKSKLHGAIVTGADLHYEGSITIAPELCRLARLQEFEKVEIYNTHNGARGRRRSERSARETLIPPAAPPARHSQSGSTRFPREPDFFLPKRQSW